MVRRLASVLSALIAVQASLGAIWETPTWALTNDDELGVGYDSNLYANHTGSGDGYFEAIPELTLKRTKSSTDLELTAALKAMDYFSKSELDSYDPSIDLEVSYPYGEFVFPTEKFSLKADRRTVVDGDIGGRLRSQDENAHWEGNIVASEKTILQGLVDLTQSDYLTKGYSDNEFATAGLSIAFVENEHLELGAGYQYEYGISKPAVSGVATSYLNQNQFNLKGRGEFLPKVSGYVRIGFAVTEYSGELSRTEVDPVGEVGVVWEVSERGKLTIKASREASFAPDGYALLSTTVGPEWAQKFGLGYTATLGLDLEEDVNHFANSNRRDHAKGGHLGLIYSVNERYAAAIYASYITQSSSVLLFNYNRAQVFTDFEAKF